MSASVRLSKETSGLIGGVTVVGSVCAGKSTCCTESRGGGAFFIGDTDKSGGVSAGFVCRASIGNKSSSGAAEIWVVKAPGWVDAVSKGLIGEVNTGSLIARLMGRGIVVRGVLRAASVTVFRVAKGTGADSPWPP